MNLKEVKKHVFFDLFLTTLIYIMIAVCLFLALIFTLAIPAKADSMKVYCDTGDYSSCISLTQGSSATGFNTNTITNFNTSSSYRYFSLSSMSLQQNLKYIFKIYYKPTTKSLKNVYFKEFYTDINNNSGTNEGYLNYTIDSEWRTGGYQSVATFTYQPTDTYRRNTSNYINLDFGSSGVTITGIDVTEVDSQTAQTIEELKDQQEELFSNECSNLLNAADYYEKASEVSVNPTPNNLMLTAGGSWNSVKYRIPVESGTTYYFKGSFTSAVSNQIFLSLSYNSNDIVGTRFWNYEPYSDTQGIQTGNWSTSFTSDRTGYVYLGIWVTKGGSSNNASYFELMFSSEDRPFCVFGSSSSKIDEQIKAQEEANRILAELGFKTDETNAYLKDDTNPNVPTSDIENTLDLVEINNPLGYLLTLPLTLISKINQSLTATCTDFELGHFGFSGAGWSTPLKFPCLHPQQQLGSALWTTIDIIVAVGLLALTVYKIYQAVSNILTLGGEDEVSGSFVYWTPMEFLAIICGGTSVGVFQRRSKQ